MSLAIADTYDGPWKFGLDHFLPQTLLLLFPACHAEIDWSRSYRSLNAELQHIVPADETASRRFADALYQVWRNDGRPQWVILHFEVQSQPDPGLPRRMFVYAYRGFEKYGSEVFGFAVLGDGNPQFRPGPYTWQLGPVRLVYEYASAKLLDYPTPDLEASDNPAALLVLAHLATADSRDEPERRRRFKLRLVRLLFRKGFGRDETTKLFKVLDWMLRLDREQSIIFTQELVTLREDPAMDTYVNTLEWYFTEQGMQRGIEQGMQRGIERGKLELLRSQLVRRFGELPRWAEARLAAADAAAVERWSLQIFDAVRLEDLLT